MKTSYRIIDMESYPRREHFNYFRSLANPFAGVTIEVDVTNMLRRCREGKYSFYLTFMHAAAEAANSVPEFRQRIHGDEIVEYSSCGTSHIEKLDDGTYCYCTLYHDMPFEEYINQAEQARMDCRSGSKLEEDEDVEALYFISTLPWLHYTELIQPTAGPDESNPRITWGKYEEDYKGRFMMPVTVLCNHALVDGIHLAKFYDELNARLG